jgi:hypothetical protein
MPGEVSRLRRQIQGSLETAAFTKRSQETTLSVFLGKYLIRFCKVSCYLSCLI